MDTEKLGKLIKKYTEGKASLEERRCLDEWYDSFDSKADLYRPFSPQERTLVSKKFSELLDGLEVIEQSQFL